MLPGDPILLLAGERGLTDERYAELLEKFGYSRPLIVQYWYYLVDIFHGDLGISFVTKRPVLTEFFTLFPATLELSLCAIVVAIAVGVPSGVVAAIKRGTTYDQALMSTALVGYSMPIFWWALLLIMRVFHLASCNGRRSPGRISLIYFFRTGDRLHADRQAGCRDSRARSLICGQSSDSADRSCWRRSRWR